MPLEPDDAQHNMLEEAALLLLAWQSALGNTSEQAQLLAQIHAWCEQSPAHHQTWLGMVDVDAQLSTLSATESLSILNNSDLSSQHLAKQNQQQLLKKYRYHCAVLVLVGSSSWFIWQQNPAMYTSPTGQNTNLALSDGSRVVLASQSKMDVSYSDTERKIALREGEIWIDVAKNPARPLTITTPNATAQALGTQYAVSYFPKTQQTTVTVTESQVKVCAQLSQKCATLTANQSIQIDATGQLSALQSVNAVSQSAWRQKRLLANNMPLSDVLFQLNRYHHGQIFYDAKAMQDYTVSGSFAIDDAKTTLQYLGQIAPIQTTPRTDYFIFVKPKN